MPAIRPPIIVTRAEPGASETMVRLEAMRLTAISAPILSLRIRPDVVIAPASVLSGLVFTSANGVRTYAARRKDRDLTAWCVGPATAKAARDAGFADVRESAGNAADLAGYIAANSEPDPKPLLHIANAAAAGTLKRTLETLGYQILFAPLYDMLPAEALPPAAEALGVASGSAIVLIHSTKGAAAFADLARAVDHRAWSAVAISAPACAPLEALELKSVHIANDPNEDSLFDALNHALATLSA